MDDMQSKLDSILGNPQMMQQIMAMAQSMGQSEQQPPPPQQEAPQSSFSAMPDAAMLQRIASIARSAGVDNNQQALLQALRPYLSGERIAKLERAMRSAKIAAVAVSALGSGGLSFLTGR